MSQLTKLFWILLTTAVSFALTTPLLAGPLVTPSAAPTATPTATPSATATPTPSATAVPTPTGIPCTVANPLTSILTLGKQDTKKTTETPVDNGNLTHFITGFIVDAVSLSVTADKIKVCKGTNVFVVITDAIGMPQTLKTKGQLSCSLNARGGTCTGTNIDKGGKYEVTSFDGTDKDKIEIKK